MREQYTPRSSSSGYRSHSSLSTTHSQYISLQRKRTLDDYPMKHSYLETVEMLKERRRRQDEQQKTQLTAKDECQQLRSFSKRRFDAALQAPQGQSVPPPTSEDTKLFFQESQPIWARKRHHSISWAQTPAARQEPVKRPDSEPPGFPGQEKTFNHLRATNSAYPRIRKLLHNLNSEYRVICTATPEICDRRRLSKDFSVASEFFLVPVEEDVPPVEPTEELAEQVALVSFGESDSSRSSDSSTSSDVLECSFQSHDTDGTMKDDLLGSDEEDGGSGLCWVDYATVSSFSRQSRRDEDLQSQFEGALLDEDIADKRTVRSGVVSVVSLGKEPQTPAASEKASAISKMGAPGKRGRKMTKKEEPEPVEAIAPPTPELPPEHQVEEVCVPEPEPEPEPVPPMYICPSSYSRSRKAEIQKWLGKSPFSAANRSVPIFS